MVREVEVLKAARDGSPSALLVYANETAVRWKPSDLPSQLQVRPDSQTYWERLSAFRTSFERTISIL